MKVYLAGPMRNQPNLNFPAFMSAAKWLGQQGHTVFNPAAEDIKAGADPVNPVPIMSFSEFMAKDLPEVCRSERIYLLPGWEASQGARLEAHVAKELKIPGFRLLPSYRGHWMEIEEWGYDI